MRMVAASARFRIEAGRKLPVSLSPFIRPAARHLYTYSLAQPLMLAACLRATGTSVFVENVFQNRFRFTEELCRLGARIHTEGRVAVVTGVKALHGAPTVATDLRGGAALIIAGLSAEGRTDILDEGHVSRGYELFDVRLRELGADVTREG